MRMPVFGLLTALMATLPAFAETLGEVLRRELVTVTPVNYHHEQISRCKLPLYGDVSEQPLTILRRIDAPRELMSRDQFVSLNTQLIILNRATLLKMLNPRSSALEAYEALECELVTGNPGPLDFMFEVTMSKSGVIVETTDIKSGKSGTDDIEWDKLVTFDTN